MTHKPSKSRMKQNFKPVRAYAMYCKRYSDFTIVTPMRPDDLSLVMAIFPKRQLAEIYRRDSHKPEVYGIIPVLIYPSKKPRKPRAKKAAK